MPSITVVIPTLNEETALPALLQTLKPQIKKGDEILVVDGGSADKTVKIAKAAGCRTLKQTTLGIGIARTYGARVAKNRIVAFLDADTVTEPDWLERIRNAFQNEIDAYYGYAFFTRENFFQGLAYDTFSHLIFFVSNLFRLLGYPNLPPNNFAVNKKMFLESGGQRAVICEEFDWVLRMRHKRLRIIFDKDSVVWTSDRRFKKQGFLHVLAMWLKACVFLLLGKQLVSKGYHPPRK